MLTALNVKVDDKLLLEVWGPHGHLVVSRSVRSGAEIYGGLTKKIHPGDPIVVTASRASELITTEEVRRPRKGR